MKKLVASLLMASLVLTMTACGSGDTEESKSSESPETEEAAETETEETAEAEETASTDAPPSALKEGSDEGYVIGFCNCSTANSARVQMEYEFMQYADQLKEAGVISEYYMTNAGGDVTKQVSDLSDLMTKGCDAILISPQATDAFDTLIDEAVEDGIPVVAWDSTVSTESLTSFVTSDQALYGKTIGKWLGEQLPDGGKVVVLNGMAGTTTNQVRYDNAVAAMKEVSPNIEIVAEANCDWDYATAKAAMENILVANPEIDGVLSQGGAMTQAAIDAFVAAGRDLVPMTGEDNNGFLKTWKANQAAGFSSVAPGAPPYQTAWALDAAIAAIRGEEVAKTYYCEAEPITDENLDEYVRTDLSDSYWVNTHLAEETILELYKE